MKLRRVDNECIMTREMAIEALTELAATWQEANILLDEPDDDRREVVLLAIQHRIKRKTV